MTTKKIADDKVDEIAMKEVLTEEDVEILADWVEQVIEQVQSTNE